MVYYTREELGEEAVSLYYKLTALNLPYPLKNRWEYTFVLDVTSVLFRFSKNAAEERNQFPWYNTLLDQEPFFKRQMEFLLHLNHLEDAFLLELPTALSEAAQRLSKEKNWDKRGEWIEVLDRVMKFFMTFCEYVSADVKETAVLDQKAYYTRLLYLEARNAYCPPLSKEKAEDLRSPNHPYTYCGIPGFTAILCGDKEHTPKSGELKIL